MRKASKSTKVVNKSAKAAPLSPSNAMQTWGDIRDVTHQIRTAIGFRKEKENWKKAPAKFTKHTLRILNHPVMEDWETPYMRELAKIATSNGGTVLEVGFGLGISAGFIQEANIKHHIIIEMNKEVAERARLFGKKSKNTVTVLEGLWEDVINTIPDNSLDGILFDTYPLSEPEIHKNHFFFFRSAYKKLKPGGVFTYYSDEMKTYHKAHIEKLIEAGFDNNKIDSKVVNVEPPKDCQYWKSNTILAPIVKK